jgi:hypothetical protein
MLNEIAMARKYAISIIEVQQEIAARLASWNRSLEGTQKKRADYTTKLGTTKSGIGVIKCNKDQTSIIISGYKLWAQYDKETLPVNDSAEGLERFKRHIYGFVAYRNYTLTPDNFEKVSIQGLTLEPSDIFSMLEELRAVA